MSWNEIIPNVFTWPYFSEEKGFNFNGYYVLTDDSAFLIDPVLASEEVWHEIEARKKPSAIYLSNKDHRRKSPEFRERFDCPIWIHEADKDLIDIPIDKTFSDGENLAGGLEVIQISDSKSPGESAFFLNQGTGILFLGDCLIGNPPGELHLLPPAKVPNPAKASDSIRKLLKVPFDALLVGDGQSFPEGGHRAIATFLE